MRKIKVSFFERRQLQEEIAREIYEQMGYTVDKSRFPEDYMEVSRHPTEIACYRAAGKILQRFTNSEETDIQLLNRKLSKLMKLENSGL